MVEHLAHDWKVVGSIRNPCPMLDGSGVKAVPGLISAPNSGSLYKKIQVAKWGTPKKYFF